MTLLLEIGLPSSLIEMPERVFLRGQTLRGRAHIVSEDEPYTAEEINIMLEMRTGFISTDALRRKIHVPLYTEKNVEITSTERLIDFKYKIPSTASFTFDSGLVRIQWYVVLSIKSGIVPRVASREIVVLPHFLKSGTPPLLDEIPTPACKVHWPGATRYSPFHLWRYTGSLHGSSRIDVTTTKEEYTVGETIQGTVIFSDHCGSGMLEVYLVFLNRSQFDSNTSEEEHLALRTNGEFCAGSSFPFSCPLPMTGYPTFESIDAKMWWIVRAVVSNPFRFTKVAEKEVFVRSLTF